MQHSSEGHTLHSALLGCEQWENWKAIFIFSVSHCPSCKSSKLLLVRGKIKRVANHPASGMARPMQQLCHTLAVSSNLQVLQELLPGALGWWVPMGLDSLEGKSNLKALGAWVLGHLHSCSMFCLPVLQQNLRLYQKSQEMTFFTVPPHPQPSSVKLSFLHPGTPAMLQTAVTCSETSSSAPLIASVASHHQTSQLPPLAWLCQAWPHLYPFTCWYFCSCAGYSPDTFLPHLEISLAY